MKMAHFEDRRVSLQFLVTTVFVASGLVTRCTAQTERVEVKEVSACAGRPFLSTLCTSPGTVIDVQRARYGDFPSHKWSNECYAAAEDCSADVTTDYYDVIKVKCNDRRMCDGLQALVPSGLVGECGRPNYVTIYYTCVSGSAIESQIVSTASAITAGPDTIFTTELWIVVGAGAFFIICVVIISVLCIVLYRRTPVRPMEASSPCEINKDRSVTFTRTGQATAQLCHSNKDRCATFPRTGQATAQLCHPNEDRCATFTRTGHATVHLCHSNKSHPADDYLAPSTLLVCPPRSQNVPVHSCYDIGDDMYETIPEDGLKGLGNLCSESTERAKANKYERTVIRLNRREGAEHPCSAMYEV